MKMLEFRNFISGKTIMQHLLPKTLPDFSRASILVVGDVMLDRYLFGQTQRISPEAPVPIVHINNNDNRPGGAANVALNIAAIGGKVTLLGITGRDEAADILLGQLTAANVICDLQQCDEVDTIIKMRIISRNQQLLRLDFENKINNIHNRSDFLQRYQNHLSHINLVILSDYQKGTLYDPQTLIQLAREANIAVLVDPKGRDFSIYKHANIITPNFKEFETIVGPCHSEEDIFTKGRSLLQQYDIETLLVTRSENGMTLITRNEAIHLPAYACQVFDVTGAGDTVIAILATTYAATQNMSSAIALANLAASLVVGKLGACTVSEPELQVALTGKTSFATGIINEEQLKSAVDEARTQGKKVVFTNGCFDIIHAGHVSTLQMAKQLGDYLIVAVNTDESIEQLKGPNRPVNNLHNRMTVLASLGMVDWVVPFADATPERLLTLLKPDVLAKGGDYRLDQVVGADIVRAYGGEVRTLNYVMNLSSTGMIKKLQDDAIKDKDIA